MTMTTGRVLKGSCLALTIGGLLFAQKQMPKTTTEKITTAQRRNYSNAESERSQLRGRQYPGRENGVGRHSVVYASGIAQVHDRRPGIGRSRSQARYQASRSSYEYADVGHRPDHDRWRRQGLVRRRPERHPHAAERREPPVQGEGRLSVHRGRQKATVFELRKGMVVKAEKIVETPRVELAQDVAVTGTAPKPKTEMAAALPRRRPRPAPRREAKAEPAPAPAPAAEPAAPAAEPAATPTKLPKTGRAPLPLMGLAGLGFAAASMLMRRFR